MATLKYISESGRRGQRAIIQILCPQISVVYLVRFLISVAGMLLSLSFIQRILLSTCSKKPSQTINEIAEPAAAVLIQTLIYGAA